MKQVKSISPQIDHEKKHDQDFSGKDSEDDSKSLTGIRFKIVQPPPSSPYSIGYEVKSFTDPKTSFIFGFGTKKLTEKLWNEVKKMTEEMWKKKMGEGLKGYLYNVELKNYVRVNNDKWCYASAIKITDALLFKFIYDNTTPGPVLSATFGNKQFYMGWTDMSGAVRLYKDKSTNKFSLQNWVRSTQFEIFSVEDHYDMGTWGTDNDEDSTELYVRKACSKNNYKFEFHIANVDKQPKSQKLFAMYSIFHNSCITPHPTKRLRLEDIPLLLDENTDSSSPASVQTSEVLSIIPPMTHVISQTLLPMPKPTIKPVDAKELKQLLQFVVEGEQARAEILIQKNKSLLLHAGTVKDLSGREFKQVTAFQYALWALDWHMWKMIKDHLTKEAQIEQFLGLESGVATGPHGKHFNFQPLIDALQIFVSKAYTEWKCDKRAQTHWQKIVGGAQRNLPIHVINEYCYPDRSFEPTPSFTEDILPRIRVCNVGHDCLTAEYNGGLLGNKFALYRGWYGRQGTSMAHKGGRGDCPNGAWTFGPWPVPMDLAAICSLSKIRFQQLEFLVSQLKSSSSQTLAI